MNGLFQAETDLKFAIEKSFKDNNITISFPQMDVHMDYKPVLINNNSIEISK